MFFYQAANVVIFRFFITKYLCASKKARITASFFGELVV